MNGITFDIDWAPAWATRACADLCLDAGHSATFFVTHDCEELEGLRGEPSIELGIHPNFLAGSSHGASIEAVLQHCMTLVPEAVSTRSHFLHQSTVILQALLRDTPVQVDVSLFLPGHQGLTSTDLYLSSKTRPLRRLAYFWEDDIAAVTPGMSWDLTSELEGEGHRIFDFHPIHVALNTASLDNYGALKRHLGARPLHTASPDEVAQFANPGKGTRDFLVALLGADASFHTIREIAGV